MRLVRSRPLAVLVFLGVVLVLVGGAWFAGPWFGGAQSASFGWFSYAPESAVSFSDGTVVLNRQNRAALGVLGLGALLLSAAVGYVLGRRAAQGSSSTAGTAQPSE